MPVVLGDTERDAERFRFTIADDVAVVENQTKLEAYLDTNPDEDLVVVGPDISMAIATEVAETYRLRRPHLGVILMRRRMEVSTMSEALRAGIREVVLADDVEALVSACRRSMAVSEQLRTVELGEAVFWSRSRKRLSELAIAIVARFWTAQFEWYAHAPQALRAGLSKDVIEAIRTRRRPVFDKKDEEAVYNYITELLEKKKVSDATYKALVAEVTQEQAIEITTIAGFYATVAMLIVAFEADLPDGEKPQLPE